MDARIIDIGLVVVGLGGWAGLYALALLWTRPASPRPGPATQDLGPEPPAIASLLANRWEFTEDAVESTLLDLAARRRLELRQPADDPMHTTIHVLDASPAGLSPYEQRVLDRVCGLAVGGVVPVTALTFRDENQAKKWTKSVRTLVVTDARQRGLSRRRFGPTTVSTLIGAAVVATLLVVVAVFRYGRRSADPDDEGLVFGAAIFTFAALAGIAGYYNGERDTPAGREVAARWLGVRDWLRGHDEFANLPPASVAVWDRYLGYGAALGVTRLSSAILDLGMGNRRLVWSSWGGTWHRVRVRYPRVWRHYGQTAKRLIVRGVVAGALGVVLLKWVGKPREFVADVDENLAPDQIFSLVERIGLLLGVALVVSGAYRILRTLIDLATERTLTGEVLWVEVWRSAKGSGEDNPSRPVLHYLALDDGSADRTKAWALPSGLALGCRDGDEATIRVRRWSRRVLTISVVPKRRHSSLSDSTVDTKL